MRYKKIILPSIAMCLSLFGGKAGVAGEFKEAPLGAHYLEESPKPSLKKYRSEKSESVATGLAFTDDDTDEYGDEEAKIANFFKDFNNFVCEELLTPDQISHLLQETTLPDDHYESIKKHPKHRKEIPDLQNILVDLCSPDLLSKAQKNKLSERNLRMTPRNVPGRNNIYTLTSPVPLYFYGLLLRYREINLPSSRLNALTDPRGETVFEDNSRERGFSPLTHLATLFQESSVHSPALSPALSLVSLAPSSVASSPTLSPASSLTSSLARTDTENTETSTEIDE